VDEHDPGSALIAVVIEGLNRKVGFHGVRLTGHDE
jgi:hypothetical protein